ncbi:hypothetical protein HPP92_009920 [Vanilla planifolia]|uniref:Mitochondrial inner membrane protease ATP23 n=1 Tax=Vanilla planifolia TaxID=51239 RepID=A0A835R544_VANPL|nr:hypothetical protein HPP92_009920 [Vanilla planifolia]
MEQAGCPVWANLILAINCKRQNVAGGYSTGNGITVCCNHMTCQDEINQVLIHELIHAYDDCRVKNMDWKNCAHHACSEIRANHLSGDCHYKRELLRGFMKIRGHEQNGRCFSNSSFSAPTQLTANSFPCIFPTPSGGVDPAFSWKPRKT